MGAKEVWTLQQSMNQLDGNDAEFRHPDSVTIINPITGSLTKTQVITYSIPDAPRENPINQDAADAFVPATAAEKARFAEAFELWDDLIAPQMRQTNDPEADITLMYDCLQENAHASPDRDGKTIHREEVWIPNALRATDWNGNPFTANFHDLSYGRHGFNTAVHEIGHTLGLAHSGSYDANSIPEDKLTYDNYGSHAQDTRQYTVMSYFNADSYVDGGGNYWQDGIYGSLLNEAQTPMLHDVATIQAMYGADLNTRSGDTVYGFNSSFPTSGVGAVYNFNVNKLPVMTIYDAGGNDTLDTSGFNMKQTIDLRAGHFSSIGGLKNNVSMAFNQTTGPEGNANFNPNAVIENAIGGSGEDTIVGNSANNILKGGASSDTLNGLEGNDTLDGGTGADRLYGGAGNDTYIVDNAGDTVSEIDVVGGSWRPNPMMPWQIEFVPVYGDMGGVDQVRASIAEFSLQNAQYVENLTFTGYGSFKGTGNDLDNVITGGRSSDTLIGGGGADTLNGGGGKDTLEGGAGNDHLTGGLGDDTLKGGADDDHYWFVDIADTVVENANEGRDDVMTRASGYTLGANVEDLLVSNELNAGVMVGKGNELGNYVRAQDFHTGPDGKGFELYGMGGKDVLGGSNAAQGDLLDGGSEDDFIYGNGGNDTLRGGLGADYLDGGADFDTADYSQAAAGVVVDLVSGGTGGEAAGDTYKNIEAVQGSAFADKIAGSDAAETFTGLGGNDTIDGRGGDDTVVLSGKLSDYKVTLSGNTTTLVDLRAGSPDGTDSITNVEHVRFSDQTVDVAKLNKAGSVSINDMTIGEGNDGTKVMTFTVTRTDGAAAFDVNFDTKAGLASAADHDYVGRSNVLHFNAGETTKTIDITINGDTKVEKTETFNLVLSNATNGATIADAIGIGTITNDDVATVPEASAPTPAPSATHAANDLGGDGISDVLFASSKGSVAVWELDGNHIAHNATVGSVPAGWHVDGIGDFGNDGKADILLHNDSGKVAMWQMDGNHIASNTTVGSVGSDWHVADIADFSGDGKADILWENSKGQVAMWKMDGDHIASNSTVGSIGTDWKVIGTDDFNGDGKADILWENSEGKVAMWQMDGDHIASNTMVGSVGDNWHAAGTGDFNGDGKADVLWQNDKGQVAMWQMNGDHIASNTTVGSAPGWTVIGTGDYNHDGKADVLWQNASGSVAQWQMNADHIAANLTVGSHSIDWHAI